MANTSEPHLLYSVEDQICTITFNRPAQLNPLSTEVYENLPVLLNRAGLDDDVRIVVLTGSGRYYSSGNDMFSMRPVTGDIQQDALFAADRFEKFTASFIKFPKPLVAALNGPAVGAAFTTACLADFVYMADSAYLMTPFGRLAFNPEGCSSVLFPRIFGHTLAMEILMLDRRVTAEEALRHGFANEILPTATFRQELQKRLKRILDVPPQCLRDCKVLLREATVDELNRTNIREMKLLQSRFGILEQAEAVMKLMAEKEAKAVAKAKAKL